MVVRIKKKTDTYHNDDSHYGRAMMQHNNDQLNVIEESDLGASLKQLNDDSKNDDNMSGIDLRARLTSTDISASVILDMLVALNFLPTQGLGITKQKKRLSVSLRGQGRREIVDIIAGERDNQKKDGSMWNKLFNKDK